MKVSYQQAANDDVVRQFRYYLVTLNLPEIAVRFRNSVRRTTQELRRYPLVGSHYRSTNPKFQNLRSWPVAGFGQDLLCRRPDYDSRHSDFARETRYQTHS